MAMHNPIPGVYVSDEGLGRVDLKALLEHFGRPSDQAQQRKLANALAEICEEHGVAFGENWIPVTGTGLN
jgi:hypothetical protein